MSVKLSNNAATILAATVGVSDTTISVAPGTGALFPSLSAGDWFPSTIVNGAGDIEIVKVTGRSGDVFTVVRAQDSTTARTFNPGDRIDLRLTAGSLSAMLAEKLDKTGGYIVGDLGLSGALSAASASLPILNGGTPWTSANFTPSTKFNVSGGTLTGVLTSAPVNAAMATSDTNASIQVQNSTGTGDANMAMLSFLCQGSYGLKMGLRADGYFGIGGWSASAWRWYVNNATGDMVAAGNVAAYSDPRLKSDVVRIRDALSIIEKLDGVRFTWNGVTQLVGKAGKRDIGVLADQVEEVLPELVGRSMPDEENGGTRWRVVAYDKLAPVIIEALKELLARVKELEDQP